MINRRIDKMEAQQTVLVRKDIFRQYRALVPGKENISRLYAKDIAELIRSGYRVEVIDGQTGKDITAKVLAVAISKTVSVELMHETLRTGSA